LDFNDVKVIVYTKYSIYNKANRGFIGKGVGISGIDDINGLNYIVYKGA
jgi:hypothetical protein